MTEPVGYGVVENNRLVEVRFFDKFNPEEDCDLVPLYTADQLHPRVKMTQAEFDEFKQLRNEENYASVALYRIQGVIGYSNLKNRIFSNYDNVSITLEKENEFNILWAMYDNDNQSETIEIVPDTKWFVQKKDCYNECKFLKTFDRVLVYSFTKEKATQFDTKEEAELWTNPLTEAVQLPVEEKR